MTCATGADFVRLDRWSVMPYSYDSPTPWTCSPTFWDSPRPCYSRSGHRSHSRTSGRMDRSRRWARLEVSGTVAVVWSPVTLKTQHESGWISLSWKFNGIFYKIRQMNKYKFGICQKVPIGMRVYFLILEIIIHIRGGVTKCGALNIFELCFVKQNEIP